MQYYIANFLKLRRTHFGSLMLMRSEAESVLVD